MNTHNTTYLFCNTCFSFPSWAKTLAKTLVHTLDYAIALMFDSTCSSSPFFLNIYLTAAHLPFLEYALLLPVDMLPGSWENDWCCNSRSFHQLFSTGTNLNRPILPINSVVV
mmetsp:Transcript_31769/g.51667  ORF Transcript_31769/g.51667 Transcript_31769/m.51667 type:complete len:112 (-) Transcript_31769:609-944(-)